MRGTCSGIASDQAAGNSAHHLVRFVKGLHALEPHDAFCCSLGYSAGKAGCECGLREGRQLLLARLGTPYERPAAARRQHTNTLLFSGLGCSMLLMAGACQLCMGLTTCSPLPQLAVHDALLYGKCAYT